MDKQKELYQAKHKNDPTSKKSLSSFNAGIKGMMVGVVLALFYHTYQPVDFLLDYVQTYFEAFVVACAILGYIIGWTVGTIFSTDN